MLRGTGLIFSATYCYPGAAPRRFLPVLVPVVVVSLMFLSFCTLAVEQVQIGVLAKRGGEMAERSWSATADYLTRKIPGYRFTIQPLGFDEILPAVELGEIAFVLANPSFYIELESRLGVTRIATLRNRVGEKVCNRFGGVIFTRSDRSDITELADIPGKRFMAVQESSLGGFHVAWGVLKAAGIDPAEDTELSFGGTHDAVVYAVRDGTVDVGTVRTDTLERMTVEGLIDPAEFHVIDAEGPSDARFPFKRSTPLYPEWPFAVTANTPRALTEAVAIALLEMPPMSQAALDSNSAGWGIPMNYQPVHELLKQLKTGLYADYGRIGYRELVHQYGPWLLAGILALLVLAVSTYHVSQLNRRLAFSHARLEQAKLQLEERVQERTQALSTANDELQQEIRERKQIQQSLQQMSKENRLLLDSAGEGIFGVDVEGRLTFINPAALAMLDWTGEELLGRSMHEMTHHRRADGAPYPAAECPIGAVMYTRETTKVVEDYFWRRDGSGFPVDYTATPILEDDHVLGAVVVFEDISVRRQTEQNLRQAAVVFETTAEGILITDRDNRIKAVNQAFSHITGYRPDEVIGKDPDILNSGYHPDSFYTEMWERLAQQGHWSGEIWNRKKDGTLYPEWLNINVVRDAAGQITEYIGVFSDISLIKDSERQLEYLAHHDPLTQLPNRILLQDRLSHALKSAHRNQGTLAVLFLDLDNFKTINDTLGHPVGDRVLKEIAKRLTITLREGDTVARFGGDEFIILLEQVRERATVEHVAAKVLAAVSAPLSLEGREIHLSTSIGISLYPEDAGDSDTLIRLADTAMYRAKESGRNRYQFHQA